MKSEPLPPDATPELRSLLRDLLARTEAAERALQVERERAESERERAENEHKRANAAEASNRALRHELEAKEKLLSALMDRVASLTRRLAAARHRPEQLALELELKLVQQRLNALNQEQFGASSEIRGRPEGSSEKEKPAKKKKTAHGPRPQPKLPQNPQLHLLDSPDQICPHCTPPVLMDALPGQTVDGEEIDVIERTFRINIHKCQIYGCAQCGHTESALGPDRLLDGGRYSVEFAATVAVDKYANAQPLANQVREMENQGLTVTTQTLWDQLYALYVLLLPAYLLLQKQILDSDVVFADETTWRLMDKGGSKRWWVWVITDGKRVYFMLAPTRGQAAARQILGDYDGVVMADRYAVYVALEKEYSRNGNRQIVLNLEGQPPVSLPTPDYTLLACWMHGRRGFVKASRNGEKTAEDVLDLIAELYAIEARAHEQVAHIPEAAEREAARLQLLGPMRDTESRAVLARLRKWLDGVVTLPELSLDKAVQWINNGWDHLVRYIEDPRLPIDNGLAERVLRGVVLGRKVYAGSRSEAGTQVAALFYSITASCRLVGVDPRAYIIEAAKRAMRNRDSAFLPEDYASEMAASAANGRGD